jgi:hypothetical protein
MTARLLSSASRMFALAACFFAACPANGFAEPGVLIPREVFIGDTAEFSFTTLAFNDALDPETVFVVPQSELPVSPDVTIESIVIARRGEISTITIRFVPWKSGVIKLPPVTMKKKSAEPQPLRIGSLVEKTGHTTLEPPRSPLLVPGTTFLLYALIAIIVAVLAVLVFAGVKIRRFLSGVSSGWSARRRMRTLNRELVVLSRLIRKQNRSVWYVEFSACVRRYLGEVSSGDPSAFLAQTVTEIMAAVAGTPAFFEFLSPARLAETESLLVRLDVIRFSGRDDGDYRAEDISVLRGIAASLEKASADYDAKPRIAGLSGDQAVKEGSDA